MPTWFEVVIGVNAVLVIALSLVAHCLSRRLLNLRLTVTFFEVNKEHLERVLSCQLAKIQVNEELLAVYRALAKKLVSAHVTSTHIHLKVRSDYAQDGDLEKALGEITAVLRDSL